MYRCQWGCHQGGKLSFQRYPSRGWQGFPGVCHGPNMKLGAWACGPRSIAFAFWANLGAWQWARKSSPDHNYKHRYQFNIPSKENNSFAPKQTNLPPWSAYRFNRVKPLMKKTTEISLCYFERFYFATILPTAS